MSTNEHFQHFPLNRKQIFIYI